MTLKTTCENDLLVYSEKEFNPNNEINRISIVDFSQKYNYDLKTAIACAKKLQILGYIETIIGSGTKETYSPQITKVTQKGIDYVNKIKGID